MHQFGGGITGITKIAGADLSQLVFRRILSSRTKSVSRTAVTKAVDQSMSNSGKEGRKFTLTDGKLPFRVRKGDHPIPEKQPVEVACKNENSSQGQMNLFEVNGSATSSESLSITATSLTISNGEYSTERRRSRRGAPSEQGLGVAFTRSEFRNVSRRKNALSTPTLWTGEELPSTSRDILEDSAIDYWHSSLSDTGVVARAPIDRVATASLLAAEEVFTAIEHLKIVDSRLRTVIEMHEGPKFEKCSSAFTSLARSIVFQQLGTKAASAIFGRVVALCGGLDNLQPVTVSEFSKAQLRAVGISERKAGYLHDLAAHFLSGNLSDLSIHDMDDDKLMKSLTAVKGLGVWSVHMFMLFSLHRPNVLPIGDLGVRKGFQKLYELKALPSSAEMEKLSVRWQPYSWKRRRWEENIKDGSSEPRRRTLSFAGPSV